MASSKGPATTETSGWRGNLLLIGGSLVVALLLGELLLWTLLPVPHP